MLTGKAISFEFGNEKTTPWCPNSYPFMCPNTSSLPPCGSSMTKVRFSFSWVIMTHKRNNFTTNSFLDNWFKFGYRCYIGRLYTQIFEQMPLAFVNSFCVWHDATKASFILEGSKIVCFIFIIPLIFNHLNCNRISLAHKESLVNWHVAIAVVKIVVMHFLMQLIWTFNTFLGNLQCWSFRNFQQKVVVAKLCCLLNMVKCQQTILTWTVFWNSTMVSTMDKPQLFSYKPKMFNIHKLLLARNHHGGPLRVRVHFGPNDNLRHFVEVRCIILWLLQPNILITFWIVGGNWPLPLYFTSRW